jgi:2-polyprenyl-3-methyl-5-hydroxy-6-metoxy-1,4-benzoquinol methylase
VSGAASPGSAAASAAATTLRAVSRAGRWALERMLAVGYGVLYDYIFERFPAYRSLQQEVLEMIAAGAAGVATPRDVHILDIGCGPGNLSLAVAAAGYSVIGVDAYEPLVTLAQEKRRARQVPNVAFKLADLPEERPFPAGHFHQVVNVHFLYAHPAPDAILAEAARVLAPGGHGVFVNLTHRVWVRPTFWRLRTEAGWGPALGALLWMLPNAVFESLRPRRTGPHYWNEAQFTEHLQAAGFEVLALRRTFFQDASLLAWVRKP